MRKYKYKVGSFICFNKNDLIEYLISENQNCEKKINNHILNNYFSNKIKKPANFLLTIERIRI